MFGNSFVSFEQGVGRKPQESFWHLANESERPTKDGKENWKKIDSEVAPC